jgi:hypothetical protein
MEKGQTRQPHEISILVPGVQSHMMITSSVYILYERAYDGEDSIEVE